MAEKKVLSLNERHNRLLSASQPRKPSNHGPLTEEGMADVTEDGKAVKTKLVGRRRLCKISRDSDDDDVPQFSGFSDFDSPSEGENPVNVEIEGRRRLFKLSSKSDDQNDNDKDNSGPEEPSFSVLIDFDSPLEANELIEKDSGGRNEVRDILDEPKFSVLSDVDSPSPAKNLNESNGGGGIGSRDLLDEQKFSTPGSDSPSPAKKMIESDNGSGNGGGDLQSPGEPEFSVPPVSDSSSLAKKISETDAGGGNGSSDLFDEQKISNFDSPPPANDLSGSDARGGNEIRDILNDLSSKLEFLSIEKKRVPKTYDLIEDSSDVIANEVKNEVKNTDMFKCTSATSPISLLSVPSDTSSEVSIWSRVGGSLQTLVDTYADEEDVPSELEGDNLVEVNKNKPFAGRQMTNEPNRGNGKLEFTGQSFGVNKTKTFDGRQMKSEPKRSNVKLDFPKQSFVLNLQEEVDDDDCVVLSNAKSSKETEKQGSKSKEELTGVGGVDEVSEWENCITLSGLNSTYLLPGKIAKMLYPHQRDGLRWLWSLHCQGKGGILGDDMGLGKTMQICGFLAGLFSSRLIKRALIVAPKTLLPHWIKELSVVGLSEKTREYFATSAKLRQYELDSVLQNNGVLLTTYDIVRNNSKALSGISYYLGERSEDSITWDYMILDEGHLIKNPSTQRAKSLLEVPSAHRIIISGTPIQNNLKELWALFNFCCPELLGDKAWFKEKYESPILRGNDKNASDREKRIGSTVAKEFRERIQPYFLRRLKNEVFCDSDDTNTAKLSKKSEIIVWLRLTSCQRQLYEAFLKSELVLSAFDGSPLAALTILKKICDHPLLLTKRAAEDLLDGMDSMLNPEDLGVAEKLAMHIAEEVTETDDFQDKHDNVSCKISFILALLNNLIPEGHKVLIFSQTRKMLNLIQESLLSKGYRFLRIDGTTKAVDRLKIVNDFQEGVGAPIFLLTSQVGGLGLTLTKADRVIVVDPAWNPSTDNQSVDRAYRIGQRKDVIVYRLMTCGTVEEKIYRKQVFKGGLFKTATEHKEQIRYFSQQDLRELFSLPKAGFDVSPTQLQLHEEHDSQYTMEEYLKDHIKFLETQGIAGVSHHSLLFSKTAPAPPEQVEEEVRSIKRNAIYGKSSSRPPLERDVDGSEYAFNPKDVKPSRRDSSMNIPGKPTEQELRERIDRLSSIFANKVTVSKLPDKGEKIQKQIVELNSELDKMKMGKKVEKEVYEYVDINGELQKVFNV